MLLKPAVEADYPAIVDLANIAYRGTGPTASWNIENFIEAKREAGRLRIEQRFRAYGQPIRIDRPPERLIFTSDWSPPAPGSELPVPDRVARIGAYRDSSQHGVSLNTT